MPLLRKDAKTWAQTRINLVMEREWGPVKMEDARRKRSPHEEGTQKEVIMEKKREEREERDI